MLRHRVLRPHQQLSEMRYDGDEADTTLHLGAFNEVNASQQDEPVGVVTLAPAPMPSQPRPGDWRLRGMAVDPAYQGLGVGRMLVQQCIDSVRTERGQRLWCNARVTAMGFYEKLGFVTHGEPFEIEHIGPHYVMAIEVS